MFQKIFNCFLKKSWLYADLLGQIEQVRMENESLLRQLDHITGMDNPKLYEVEEVSDSTDEDLEEDGGEG